MKIEISKPRTENGSAVIVVLILLFAMVAFTTANSRALGNLKKQMQALELQHSKTPAFPTNHVSTPAPK